MKRFKLLFLLFFALSSMMVVLPQQGADEADDEPDAKVLQYIGVDGCKKCHKTTKQGKQFKIWEASAHAQAYETLKSEKAAKIAKEKGLKVAAHEAPQCLKCHVTGHDAPADMLGPKYEVAMGVQCESCHGAGSFYKSKKVMKSREASLEKGMTAALVKDGSAEKLCVSCHNKESPTYKPFVFNERWKEIEHPVPSKK